MRRACCPPAKLPIIKSRFSGRGVPDEVGEGCLMGKIKPDFSQPCTKLKIIVVVFTTSKDRKSDLFPTKIKKSFGNGRPPGSLKEEFSEFGKGILILGSKILPLRGVPDGVGGGVLDKIKSDLFPTIYKIENSCCCFYNVNG